MARRGRPPGTDSTETRARIVDVARGEFARSGYAATAMTGVAASAGLAPSAIYHYFDGKADLYEAVFEVTSSAIWGDLGGSATGHATLVDSIASIVEASRQLSGSRPQHSEFLALVPIEARLHAEFAHLLDRRSKYQDDTFGSLAELSLRTGELNGFDQFQATEIIRSVIMGWFFERHFRGSEMEGSGDAIVQLFTTLATR
jgi:AcrR family transcriptional regulator